MKGVELYGRVRYAVQLDQIGVTGAGIFMRSRCGSYQRRARSSSAGHPARPAFRSVTVSTKAVQTAPARGGDGAAASAPIRAGAAPGHRLHPPESGDAVARILDKSQQSQHILDVSRIQEFEPAELHERK